MKKSFILYLTLTVIFCVLLFITCEDQPTEPLRENPLDGMNPNFVPQILDIDIGQYLGVTENPVGIYLSVNGAPGAISQMQIGQVNNSGDALNVSWQNFDSTTTLNFTGTFGTKWLAAKVQALNRNESAIFYKSFTLGINVPSGLIAQATENSIVLSWTDNSSLEQGYKIERKTGSGGTYSQIATVGSNIENYTDSGLQDSTTYYYRVRAYNSQGNSGYSNEANASTYYEQTFPLGTTGLSIEMVYIPPGSFMQGRYSGEQGSYSNEDPQHLVTLDYGFWLGKYEVTQAQWEAIAGSWSFYFNGYPDRPAEMVSWDDITNTFLPELNSQTGSNVWRLPSESEWEYACRAGTTTRYYWGDDLSETQIGNYAWYSGNSSSTTHTVGTREPNTWNLYDMSGNVWEWLEDYRHSNYTGAPTNGDPWLIPSSSSRVLRGGSWGGGAGYCRSAYRNYYGTPSFSVSLHGFRMVFSP